MADQNGKPIMDRKIMKILLKLSSVPWKFHMEEKCLYKRLNLKYNIEDIEIYLMYVLMRTKKRLYLG